MLKLPILAGGTGFYFRALTRGLFPGPGRDASLRHTVITLGGDLVRVSPTATFADKGGDVEMLGVYFADAGQQPKTAHMI